MDAQPMVAGAGLTKTMAPRKDTAEVRLPLPSVVSDVCDFYRNFIDTALGCAEPLVKNQEVRRILLLMEAAFESDRTGAVVAFE